MYNFIPKIYNYNLSCLAKEDGLRGQQSRISKYGVTAFAKAAR